MAHKYEVKLNIRVRIPVIAYNTDDAEDMAFAVADDLCDKFPSDVKGESYDIVSTERIEKNVRQYEEEDEE